MELFVYQWDYKLESIYGHCLDENGKYILINICDYKPYCFIEGEDIPLSHIVPIKTQKVNMATSLNISDKKTFCKVWFYSYKDMNYFAKENKKICFMDEISPTTFFLSDSNLETVGWILVSSVITQKDNLFVTSFANVTQIKNKNTYSCPKIMAFDIEVKSEDMNMPKAYKINNSIEIISIVIYKDNNFKIYLLHKYPFHLLEVSDSAIEILCNNEYELILKFFDAIKKEDPDVITGYNIFGFDFSYICDRLQLILKEIPNVGRGIDNSVNIIKVDWSSSAYGYNKYDKFIINGRLILDMYLYFRRMKLDKYSLNFVSNTMLGESKIDMPINKMMDAMLNNNVEVLKDVAKYCIRDSQLVIMLFNKVDMWLDVCEMAKVTRCCIEDLYTRGEQVKVVTQCIKECIDRKIVLVPQKYTNNNNIWHEYEGAYVISPKKGMYKQCALLDFQSLYPSIIIAFNICPSTYVQQHTYYNSDLFYTFEHMPHKFKKQPIGLLPGMIKNLLEERQSIKKYMKTIQDKSSIQYIIQNRRQNALKICANSVYGIMGFKNSKYFGHVGCAESVTNIGRLYLNKIVTEIQNKYLLNVIYGDTDSCMIHMPNKSQDEVKDMATIICNNITSNLPKPMALIFESYYKNVILLSKKRYIMLDENNKLHYKGVISTRRDYCKYVKNMYKDLVYIITQDNSDIHIIQKVVEYIDTKIQCLINNNFNINDLIMTKSVKELDSYKTNQPHVTMAKRLVSKGLIITAGTRLEYIYVKEGNTQADKMITPDEVKVLDNYLDKIDVVYYIKKQMLSQIEDLLDIIGIKGYIKNKYL